MSMSPSLFWIFRPPDRPVSMSFVASTCVPAVRSGISWVSSYT